MRQGDRSKKIDTQEELCELLATGLSLVSVCKRKNMPSVRSVQVWMGEDDEYSAQIMRAREAGYLIRGDQAVEAAKSADDAPLGRLAFDAERWYLGKLSNAFSDNKPQSHKVELGMAPETAAWLGIAS